MLRKEVLPVMVMSTCARVAMTDATDAKASTRLRMTWAAFIFQMANGEWRTKGYSGLCWLWQALQLTASLYWAMASGECFCRLRAASRSLVVLSFQLASSPLGGL